MVSQEAAELGPHRRVRIRIDETNEKGPAPADPSLGKATRDGQTRRQALPSLAGRAPTRGDVVLGAPSRSVDATPTDLHERRGRPPSFRRPSHGSRGGGGGCPPRGRVARGKGSDSGLGSPPPSLPCPLGAASPGRTTERDGATRGREEVSAFSLPPGDPGCPTRHKQKTQGDAQAPPRPPFALPFGFLPAPRRGKGGSKGKDEGRAAKNAT